MSIWKMKFELRMIYYHIRATWAHRKFLCNLFTIGLCHRKAVYAMVAGVAFRKISPARYQIVSHEGDLLGYMSCHEIESAIHLLRKHGLASPTNTLAGSLNERGHQLDALTYAY